MNLCGNVQADVMIAVVLFLLSFIEGSASTCSWSNEGCTSDADCCSKSCHRHFEGVNPRCRHSSIGESCIFNYHCGDDLECGPQFNCCAPYWKMCRVKADCCDPQHVCKPADGFYYDRCLYPSDASIHSAVKPWAMTLLVTVNLFLFGRLSTTL